jgi:hypothetical protein
MIYTKGNSPSFYTHDLDQEAGLKNASTSQAWGHRGADKQQALSLRFALRRQRQQKKMGPEVRQSHPLASIDAVLVTAEPNRPSHHSNAKQLLFA